MKAMRAGRVVSIAGTHAAYEAEVRRLEEQGVATTALAVALAEADLAPGALIFDVGAHVGLTAIVMALLRPDCEVVAFEPVPDALDCLRRNLAHNAIENVVVAPVAVTDHAEGVRMTNSGPWSVVGHGELICSSIRLDDRQDPPDFIKIDVEGSEPNVLAGASRCLAHQPFVFMEFNTWTLLAHHYDPITFADALIANAELLGMWGGFGEAAPVPGNGGELVHRNIIDHRSVSDVLFRPRSPLPSLAAMTG
jgi:hypothetical protein